MQYEKKKTDKEEQVNFMKIFYKTVYYAVEAFQNIITAAMMAAITIGLPALLIYWLANVNILTAFLITTASWLGFLSLSAAAYAISKAHDKGENLIKEESETQTTD